MISVLKMFKHMKFKVSVSSTTDYMKHMPSDSPEMKDMQSKSSLYFNQLWLVSHYLTSKNVYRSMMILIKQQLKLC